MLQKVAIVLGLKVLNLNKEDDMTEEIQTSTVASELNLIEQHILETDEAIGTQQ